MKPTPVNDPEPEKRNVEDVRQKKASLGQQIVSASKPRKLSRTASVSSVASRSPKKSLSRMESIAASEPLLEDDVYNGLDASVSDEIQINTYKSHFNPDVFDDPWCGVRLD